MDNGLREDKLFNFRPVFFSVVFFALGIGLYCLHNDYGVSVLWGFTALVTVAPVFFRRTKKGKLLALVCALWLTATVFLGFGCTALQLRSYRDCGVYQGEYTVSGRVVEMQVFKDRVFVTVDDVRVDGLAENGRLIAYLPATYGEKLSLSDLVVLHGYLRTDTTAADRMDTLWSVGEDVRFSLSVEEVAIERNAFDLFLFVRERMRKVVYAGMDETTAAVTMALLTGDTSGIESGLLENIRYGGIAHVFAVSGLHVGVLFAFCLGVIKKTPLRRANKGIRFLLPCLLLLFYGGVCGFSASVIRAVIMCLVLYASGLWFMGSDSLERVGLAAFVVLLLAPTALFEVGFQLSFAACIGILLFARRISRAFDALWVKLSERSRNGQNQKRESQSPPSIMRRACNAVVSTFAVTASAQIATTPLLIKAFGYLSGWSLLFNVLLVPLISGAFVFLLGLVAVACLLPIAAAPIILYIPSVCLTALLLVFEMFDLSSFALRGVTFSWHAYVSYYAATLFLTDKWNIKKSLRILLFFLFLVVFGVTVYAFNA